MLKQELTELSFPTNLKHKPVVGVNGYMDHMQGIPIPQG